MTFKELTVSEFVQAVAEGSPTPGGGSVSSLIAGLSSALVGMVGSLTAARLQAKATGKPSGKDTGACRENAADPKLRLMLDMVSTANHLRTSFLAFADEDSAAYDRVIAAYRLPKSTEEEKEARSLAIQDALKDACLVPAQVVKLSLEVLRLAEAMAEHGMKSAMSDVAVACLAAWAGMRGAHFNVRINLPSIKDESFVNQVEGDMAICMSSGSGIFEKVMAQIEQAL
ncbi:MAG: cyclodeaminase/cyclohydrolase family protein [Firmicutes bacterium]|nr:cyclodeaminase/cyclohydrolase family protein [Bacillota bacterium]